MTTMMWVRWLLYLCVPCCVVCTDQMLFWVDDLISQNKVTGLHLVLLFRLLMLAG